MGSKLMFWFTIGLVAAVWIWLFKGIAASTNIPSLQKFAEAL